MACIRAKSALYSERGLSARDGKGCMRPSIGSVAELVAAARVAARYLAMLPSYPGRTQRFMGSVLRYIAAYNHHALYPQRLPERLVHELFPGIEAQEVCLTQRFEDKALPYGEVYVLAAITAFLRPRMVFEIGTFTGAASLIIAQQAGAGCAVYTLDVPAGYGRLQLRGVALDPPESDADLIGERFRGTEYERQITQLYGDSATFDFTPYTGQMDLVFVDGSHSYEYVMNDTQRALKMLTPHGTIIWDDCSTQHPGVAEALDRVGAALPIYRISKTRFALHTRSGRQRPAVP
jgi:predicted O-methyltransferase YrrM